MDCRYMKIAALGRPLYPGMLYDCHRDSFIPGVTLWDKNALSDNLDVHQKPKTHLKFAASDSLSDKANLLDISSSLKASFLGGLVEVEGSAKYLLNSKSSTRQCRVTMQYSQTTKFEQLTMKELGVTLWNKNALLENLDVHKEPKTHLKFAASDSHSEKANLLDINASLKASFLSGLVEVEGSAKYLQDTKSSEHQSRVTMWYSQTTKFEQLTMKELGVTLWDKNALRDDLDVHQKPKTHLKFATSDSLSDKAKLIDINASLKASFLGGLVEVGGSAKYLLDTKSSARQCRVTMQYSQTTKFEQLTMKELGNITYPEVFDQKTATHVVTAVLYGAQVFMVFDYTSAENENKQEIEGNLHAMVKKIPTISIEGQASLKMTEDEKKMSQNISVTLYGDIELEENPTTYKEALEVYKKVPTLMKQQGKGVPLTVWLYPLNLLDDKAAKLVREISLSLVSKTESLLEEINEMERICNDLIKRQITDDFPDLRGRLLKFQALHKNYTSSFKNALFRVLPAIRGGTQEGKALEDILKIHYTSPFNASNMNKWLDGITSELNILSSYTSGLKDLIVKSSGSFNSICFHPDVDAVVCLSFTSLNDEDSYLAALQDSENSEGFTMSGETSERDLILQKAQPWFTSPDNSARMRQNISLFTTFLEANKNEKKFKFIIASIPDSNNPGISIRLYQNGSLTDPKFQPVSKPPKPVVETGDGKVTLKLSKSPTGETVRFRVEYRMRSSTDSAEDVEKWTVIDTSDTQNTFTLTGLQATEQYWVRYRAVSNVGVSEASDSVPFTFRGKLIVTVDQWNFSTPMLINKLRTKILNSPSDGPHPVCKPNKPYLESIPGGLRPGIALFFQGVVPKDFTRFEINLQTTPKYLHDIALHFNPRVDCVALYTCRNGSWEHPQWASGNPFVQGAAFDIILVIKQECYEVMVNGLEYCTFQHHIPVDTVTTLDIRGDVFMNTFTITEVMVNGLEYCTFQHRIPVDTVTTLHIRGDVFMDTIAITEVGVTLWNKNALRDDLDVRPKPKTHLDFAASDSLSEKANLLDINASLEASFLSGLVEVGGSAKYLLDTKSSTRQCRVTMQYSQTTKFEQLTMKELGNITYPEVFDQKTATHVVTAVLYGAQVFMVFDYTSAENESKQEIEGNLHALVKKVPNFSLDGEASLNMTEDEKKMAKNISVKFYGDIELEENPTTYKEALDVYKKVPALMKQQQDKGVPLTVWLYPLNLLDSKAAELVREICLNMVCETESLLEDLDEMERICKDLMKRQITDEFPDLKNRLLKFHALHKNYKCSFKNALFRVLPAIRGGRQEDKALGDILNIHYRSPFNVSNMSKWLDDITSELNILSSYTSGLKDLAVIKSSGSLNSICLHPDVDAVVCLSFTSLNYEDAYLAALEEFKKSEAFTMLRQTSERDFILHAAQPWFTSPDISARMKQNLSLFTTFSMANKNEKRIKFIIASISDPSNPGTSIQLYQNGSLKNPKFQPVSKPPKPVVETSDGKVTLKLSKSPTGETVHFRVEYRLTPSTDSETDVEEWTTIDTSNMQNIFTLAGLKQEEQYWVRYRAVSNEGISDASDSVHFIFRRKLNVTVDQWNWSTSTFGKEIITGISRTKSSDIQSDVPHPVCNPHKPYLESIPGVLRPGVALFFQGIVPADCNCFEINLQTGPNLQTLHDIALHFKRGKDSVVLNSCRNGTWEHEEKAPENPFVQGGAFDIIIVIKPECYEMMVNGLEYCSFKHRILVDNVTTLYIRGDIFMNTFALTEVDDVNLNVSITSPANF
ncbi:hypothetical protein KOW79_020806 [Hemibagrus wyckioides]|uniref:Uncharacterized protein n=1 Tax=Hemibagrus wyckioides TaxID=337641 RepID=A0A9D3N5F3_9TELE|nr:hypothetical protein KOW79_020806 [Hemibagrus wyckioides]